MIDDMENDLNKWFIYNQACIFYAEREARRTTNVASQIKMKNEEEMKMFKKKASALLALVLALTMTLCACGNKETKEPDKSSEGKPSSSAAQESSAAESEDDGKLVDEDVTLTMFVISPFDITADSWIYQKIKEYTGITVEPIVYSADVSTQKLGSYFASGELPDIMLGCTSTADMNKYGDQGALANVLDYVDVMPNLKELILDDPVAKVEYDAMASTSGKNYTVPVYRLNRDVNHGMLYRADVFEELGIEPWGPGDTDAFYENLKALKAAYPDSYPLTLGDRADMIRWVHNWGMNADSIAYDYEKEEWYIACVTDAYKEFLDFFQKLYAEGLLDPEYVNATGDTFNEAFLTNKSFVTNAWIGRMAMLDTAAQTNDPNTTFDLVYGYPLESGKILSLPYLSNYSICVANNENTEISMKLLDWFLSPEGSEITTIGVEGENFTWNADGTLNYPDLGADEALSITWLEEEYGMWSNGLYIHPDRRSCYFAFTEKEQEAQDMINNDCGYLQPIPTFTPSEADTSTWTDLTADLKDAINVFTHTYITTPSMGDDDFKAFVDKVYNECKADKLLEIYNK